MSLLAADLTMACGDTPVAAGFDFLRQGLQQWDAVVETEAGELALREGGSVLGIDGVVTRGANAEYSGLYTAFEWLVRSGTSDVDVTPLRLVADAFLLAKRHEIMTFTWQKQFAVKRQLEIRITPPQLEEDRQSLYHDCELIKPPPVMPT